MQNAAIEMHWLMVNHVSRLKKAEKPKMLVWRTEFGRGVFFFGKLNKPCGYWFCQKWLLIISKRPKKSSEWCYFILIPPLITVPFWGDLPSWELICLHTEMVMSELLSGMLVCCAWTGREFTSELMTQVRVVGGTSSVPDYYILQLSCCTLQALPFWYSCWLYRPV